MRVSIKVSIVSVLFLIVVGICALQATGVMNSNEPKRSDVIKIALPSDIKNPEMPPVYFKHDMHTTQLPDTDCSGCHQKKENKYQFDGMRTQVKSYDELMTYYHELCIGCHQKKQSSTEKTLPTEASCRGCHKEEFSGIVDFKPITFNRSLHYRHEQSESIKQPQQEKNCAVCHHEFDEIQKKLIYTQGKEGACRHCHLKETKDNVRNMQSGSHESCVNCHNALSQKKIASGPITCSGCHDPEEQAKIKQMTSIPRLQRNQPDKVLLASQIQLASGQQAERIAFMPVAFDHVLHEQKMDTCHQCHHSSMEGCSKCHTLSGDKKGNFVLLSQSMHLPESDRSCIGCHKKASQEGACAGCHSQMTAEEMSKGQCENCHVQLDMPSAPLTEEGRLNVLDTLIAKRQNPVETYDETKIPTEVKIDGMMNEYEGVKLPHAKIIHALEKSLLKNKMTLFFHRNQGTVCLGCHHHSPASSNPPPCASCHGKASQSNASERPNLKAAYHGQCMGCHDKMNIQNVKSTDCTVCHLKRAENLQQPEKNEQR
ncbi:MAG: cytochrome C [Desulfobacterales bacterium]|nr:cytochrome C [Desulfobacterales bacterium]